ncbi:MAG: uracil phosphoribosyltransferase, partial [Micromonosporaceae bacterium]
RQLVREISLLLAYEVTRELELTMEEIETPVAPMVAPVLAGKKLCFVSILRAGNGILDGMLDLVPSARVGHIGLWRDPKTLQPVEYYFKVPADLADRLSAVESRLSELADSVRRSVDRMLQAFRQSQPREVEALLQLYRDHLPRAPMPPSGQWALDPSGLLELLSRVPRDRPSLVLELGSGTSTVWLAYALERSGGRLVSVDHDPGYGQRTRDLLERHELSKVAEVRDAPLREVTVGGQERRWYDPTAFADVAGVDLLFIDGPPGATGPLARYPALPLLLPRLAPEALVVLDDAHRPDEQETVRRWLAEVDGLSPVPATVGTVAVLRYRAPTGRDDTDIAL